MGYHESFEAAGAKVLEYEEFGSYQGDWWAKVSFEGRDFWVHGSFGSCSGCDAFEAEFDCGSKRCEAHRYEPDHPECEACSAANKAFSERLADFGRGYLVGGEFTQEEAEKEAGRHIEWDSEAREALEFIRAHAL